MVTEHDIKQPPIWGQCWVFIDYKGHKHHCQKWARRGALTCPIHKLLERRAQDETAEQT